MDFTPFLGGANGSVHENAEGLEIKVNSHVCGLFLSGAQRHFMVILSSYVDCTVYPLSHRVMIRQLSRLAIFMMFSKTCARIIPLLIYTLCMPHKLNFGLVPVKQITQRWDFFSRLRLYTFFSQPGIHHASRLRRS